MMQGTRIEELEQQLSALNAELQTVHHAHLDLTERLRQSEGMVSVLSEHSTDLTYIIDADGKFTYAAPPYAS